MSLSSSCSCLYPIQWSHGLNREWRYSWSSTDRQYSNYIWVNNLLLTKVRLISEVWRYYMWKRKTMTFVFRWPMTCRISIFKTRYPCIALVHQTFNVMPFPYPIRYLRYIVQSILHMSKSKYFMWGYYFVTYFYTTNCMDWLLWSIFP